MALSRTYFSGDPIKMSKNGLFDSNTWSGGDGWPGNHSNDEKQGVGVAG